jgi:hypothetical protein
MKKNQTINKWIKLNLPYESKPEYFDASKIKFPNLSKRAKKELGFTKKDIDLLYDQYSKCEMDNASIKIMNKIDNKYDKDFPQWKDGRWKEYCKSKNPRVKALGQWSIKCDQYQDWLEKQPEHIAYMKEYDEQAALFEQNKNKNSFCQLGLNQPGTLVEIEIYGNTKQYLIGDINPLVGVCDDCVAFEKREAIVKRYKIVWSK